jgi:hypothetical protein
MRKRYVETKRQLGLAKLIEQTRLEETNNPAISSQKIEELDLKSPPLKAKLKSPKTDAEPTKRGKKRTSTDEAEKPGKKPKLDTPAVDSEDESPRKSSALPNRPRERGRKPKPKRIIDSDDEEAPSVANAQEEELVEPKQDAIDISDAESSLSSLIDDPPPKSKSKSNPKSKPKPVRKTAADSESELSSLLDKDTKPKNKPKSKARASKPKRTSSETKPTGDVDDEIKTLQGWLLKCGIRKKWNQVLAPYDMTKEKVAYLKNLLKDIGMGGKYTAAKAKQIKDERELQAELEAVTEYDKGWGVGERSRRGVRKSEPKRRVIDDDEDEDDDEEKPKKKAVEYDFGDEESD